MKINDTTDQIIAAPICDIIAILRTPLLPKTELAKAKLTSIVNILSTLCSSR